KQRGILPATLLDKPSWLSVVNSVSKYEAMFGIVYKDTYDELSEKAKQMVNAFATSEEKVIFHGINLSPKAIAYKSDLDNILLNMDRDALGKDVLQDLHIKQWRTTTKQEIDQIQHLLKMQ
ncbi:MAG TPA: hypothetical protein V6C95_02520, partial [Coleofasciculaceae cyanobacterium]